MYGMGRDRYKISKGRIGRGQIANVILACISVAGILTIAALAPNAIQALSMFGISGKRYRVSSYIRSTANKLQKEGLIEFKRDGENIFMQLTKKGEEKLEKYQTLEPHPNERPEKWDGKWRLVVFDIKESTRNSRDQLRHWLTDIGFVRIQNSVWVYPYDREEFIFLLKTDFELGRSVLFATVEKLENDGWIRKKFGLRDAR